MKDKLVIVRIKRGTREKLKVVAAERKITLQELLEILLEEKLK